MEDFIQWLASFRIPSYGEQIDPELALKALISALGALWGFLRSRDALRSSRKRLLADLEVMRLLDKDDPNYQLVKDRINERLVLIYGAKAPSRWRRMFEIGRESEGRTDLLKKLHLPRAFVTDVGWLVLIIYHALWTKRLMVAEDVGWSLLVPGILTLLLCVFAIATSRRISFLLAAIWIVSFVYLIFYNTRIDRYWWATLAGLMSFIGIWWLTSIEQLFDGYERMQPIAFWTFGLVVACGVIISLSHLAEVHIENSEWWGLLSGFGASIAILAFSAFMLAESEM